METLADAALRYADLGYLVFPLRPGEKIPLPGSRGFFDATCDLDQVERAWSEHPTANIGIATTGILVVDIDGADNPWPGDPALELELAIGPAALTPRGGMHRWFRQPDGDPLRCTASVLGDGVDTRADGGYVVVPPSTTAEGAYRWVESFELTDSIRGLPLPPAWLLDRLQAVKRIEPGAVGNVIPEGQRDGTLTRIAGINRRAGMGEAEILALLQVTNRERCQPPIPSWQVRKIARSVCRYEPDQITTAMVEDWTGQMAPTEDEAAAESIQDPGPFPSHLLSVPGFVGELADYMVASAFRPQPILALACALTVQGTLAGRKVRDELNNRTNLYCIGVAPSGAGKEHARQVAKKVLLEASGESKAGVQLEGPEEIASDAGLLAVLQQWPTRLFLLDEIGRLLTAIKDARQNAHLQGIITAWLKLYSSASTTYSGRAYADTKRNTQIDQPCASIYGTTVPESLFSGITSEALTDGFLARLLVFEAPESERQYRPLAHDLPRSIIDRARWWVKYQPTNAGDLNRVTPEPDIILTTEPAQIEWRAMGSHVDERKRLAKPDARAVWSRVEQNARRLALIYACSRADPDSYPVIDPPAVYWAGELAIYLAERLICLASTWLADSQHQKHIQQAIRLIQKAGGEISGNQLTRGLQHLRPRDRKELIDDLHHLGLIVKDEVKPPKGRPRAVFRLSSLSVRGVLDTGTERERERE